VKAKDRGGKSRRHNARKRRALPYGDKGEEKKKGKRHLLTGGKRVTKWKKKKTTIKMIQRKAMPARPVRRRGSKEPRGGRGKGEEPLEKKTIIRKQLRENMGESARGAKTGLNEWKGPVEGGDRHAKEHGERKGDLNRLVLRKEDWRGSPRK